MLSSFRRRRVRATNSSWLASALVRCTLVATAMCYPSRTGKCLTTEKGKLNREYCPEGTRKDAKKGRRNAMFFFSSLFFFLCVLPGALWAVFAVQESPPN